MVYEKFARIGLYFLCFYWKGENFAMCQAVMDPWGVGIIWNNLMFYLLVFVRLYRNCKVLMLEQLLQRVYGMDYLYSAN